MSTGVDDPVHEVIRGQLWLDLEAAGKTPGRRRLLRVIAVQGSRATCRVESDTHQPAAARTPEITRVGTHRMVGGRHLRRYELVEGGARL